MYFPGSFGRGDDSTKNQTFRSEPAVFKAVLVLIGILLFWTFCFIGGVLLGFGWYAWPIGSVFLGLMAAILSIYSNFRNG